MQEENEKPPPDKDLLEVFKEADTDGGGTVDWEEFAELYLRVKKGLVKGLPKHVLAKATKEKIQNQGSSQGHAKHLDDHHTKITEYIDTAMARLEAKLETRLESLERALVSKLGPPG